MKKYIVLMFLICASTKSFAVDCPVDDNETIKMITENGICFDGAEIARSCAHSTATEVIFAEAASDLCKDGYKDQMKPETKKAYKVLENLCDKNSSRATGIYYQALFAMCKLDVDVLMNNLHNTAQ